jgi:hypothetical protein
MHDLGQDATLGRVLYQSQPLGDMVNSIRFNATSTSLAIGLRPVHVHPHTRVLSLAHGSTSCKSFRVLVAASVQ